MRHGAAGTPFQSCDGILCRLSQLFLGWSKMSKVQFPKVKRPVDKQMHNILDSGVGTAQVNALIRTSIVAETFSGGHIVGGWSKDASAIKGHAIALLIVLRDGATISSLDVAANATPYKPEQDVLWASAIHVPDTADQTFVQFSNKIKTQRKFLTDDKLYLVTKGSINSVANFFAVFTSFFKQ